MKEAIIDDQKGATSSSQTSPPELRMDESMDVDDYCSSEDAGGKQMIEETDDDTLLKHARGLAQLFYCRTNFHPPITKEVDLYFDGEYI